ncbi:hypothetical protein ONZ45_g12622 [Pleurotus djamor]|nr:hypothetical protein ONZ45_g12622 [Pleurotus djamor]
MGLTNVTVQKEIDDRILELEAEIRVHRWRRNRHSAISQLPVEVISQIFLEGKLIACGNDVTQPHDLHSLHQPPQPPRRSNIDSNRNWLNVSNVCRDWHNIVIDTPRLWSSITLGPADRALEMLKRSKSVPLQIRYTSTHDTPSFLRLSEAFMSQIHRIREIEIPSSNCYSMEFLLTNENAEASMLEVLKLDGTNPYALPEPVLNRGMPCLRFLTLANGTLTKPLPPLPRLTHLTINPSPVVSVELLLMSLRNTPNVESMSIACLSHTPSPHTNLPTVSLPRLNHFCVSSSSIHASKIFDAMRYPRSTAIHYSTQRGHTRDEDLSSLQAVCSRYSLDGTAPILQLTVKVDDNFLQMAAYTSTTTAHPASLSIMLPKSAGVLVASARLCSALPLSTIPRLLLHGLPTFNPLSSSFRQVRTLELSACHPAVIRSLLKDPQGQLPMPRLRKLMLSSFRLSNSRIQRNEDLCKPLKNVLAQRKAKHSKIQSLVLTQCTVSSRVVNELRQLAPVDWDGFGPMYLEMEEMEEEDDEYPGIGSDEDDIDAYLYGDGSQIPDLD